MSGAPPQPSPAPAPNLWATAPAQGVVAPQPALAAPPPAAPADKPAQSGSWFSYGKTAAAPPPPPQPSLERPLVLELEARVERDAFWKYLFLTCLLAVYGYGFAVVGMPQSSGPATAWPTGVLPLLFLSFPGGALHPSCVGRDVPLWWADTPASGIVGGYLTVGLLRTKPWFFIPVAMVWASVVSFATGIYFAVGGQQGEIGVGVVIMLIAIWNAYVFYSWRQGGQLDLVARLLSTACAALAENTHLISCSVLLQIAASVLIFIPVFGFSVAALNVAPTTGNAFFGFATFFALWASGTAMEVQLYITAHVIARWYEQPAGVRLEGTPVRDAFRLATTKAFGSCACGGMVLTLIETVRECFRRMNSHANPAVRIVLNFIEGLFLRWVQFLTRFNTVRVAMTGESFREAGRGSQALLSRNGCDARAACYMVPIVLYTVAFGGSMTYAFVMRILFAVLGGGQEGWGMALFGISCAIVWLVLSFLCSLLQSIVDTLYVCYVTDKERARSSRPDVHTIMHEVVEKTQKHVLVAQPDGELGYGGGGGGGRGGRPQTRAEWLNS